MDDPEIFGRVFTGDSWAAWRAALKAIIGLAMTAEEVAGYQACTGRTTAPTTPAREAWIIAGRRAGKSRVAAAIATYLACFVDHTAVLAPGEVGTIMLLAADRKQARVLFRYIRGLLELPLLAGLVIGKPKLDRIALRNRVEIEIHTANFRATRGYTVLAAVLDEVAFWRSEDSANPDTEIVNAIRPGMSTVPGALLVGISSPYAKRGALWQAYARHFGQDNDPILVWRAATQVMNARVDPGVIAEAYAADEAAARAEYGGEFRADLESYVDPALVADLVPRGRQSQPATLHVRRYHAFADPAGGSGSDSMTLAIAHLDPRSGRAVLDHLAEARPPFSPEQVVAEFAGLLTHYRIRKVIADRFAGDWPKERFRVHGIAYEPSERTKSQIYGDILPQLNSRGVELLDSPRLVAQLVGLERRTAWGGRDSIDHSPGGHDDLANAACGALLLAARPTSRLTPFGARSTAGLSPGLSRRPTITLSRPPTSPPSLPTTHPNQRDF